MLLQPRMFHGRDWPPFTWMKVKVLQQVRKVRRLRGRQRGAAAGDKWPQRRQHLAYKIRECLHARNPTSASEVL